MIVLDIKTELENALATESFDPTFITQVTDSSQYEFLVKVLGELGHDVSVRKSLLGNDMITNGALAWVSNLRAAIINDNVFQALSSGKEVIKALKVG